MPRGRKPGFNETCDSCGRDLHVCLNCRFFLPGARGDCAESEAEAPTEKDRRNQCDWFEADPRFFVATAGKPGLRRAADKARDDFDRLFGGGS